ncbi:MAG: beta-ketoacyl-ACP reductase [Rhodopirellula sp.]|nr:beta-ketoacyl-ACP reductase [Rhodopirellula sp.]|tara:strand:- start:5859 stop:6614 length:756 start_codon:yes stop_codon:yes gene_type:complete
MPHDFSNKTAVVTGGSRGIGRAIAKQLAAYGARVCINYRASQELAEQVVAEISQAGVQAIAVQADVSDQTQAQRLIAEAQQQLGPVDFLINNAGIFDVVAHDEFDEQLWHRTMKLNVDGVFYCTWAVKDAMVERGYGRIVNLASIAGLEAKPYSIAYATSKAAVVGFTRSLGQALAPENVRVNAVAPGLIDTEILHGVDPALLEKLIELTPAKRIGQVEEVANLVSFLLSDESDFIVGQTMVVSGGRVNLP